MARKAKQCITCVYFSWNLIRRQGVYYADGRRNTPNLGKHSLGTRDQGQALESLRRLDHQKAIEMGLVAPLASQAEAELAIDRIWEEYLQYCSRPAVFRGVGVTTMKRYRAVRDKHVEFCQQRKIQTWNAIDQRAVEQYGVHLKSKDYADATIYLEGTLIKQVIKWLIENRKSLPESHRVRLSLSRSHVSTTYCFTREQVTAMIEHCRCQPALQWLADLIFGLAHTGMRIGEAISLRWSDIDLTSGILTLPDNRHSGSAGVAKRTTKGKRTRRIPIHPALRTVFEEMTRRDDGRVFSGPAGEILKADVARNALIRAVLAPLKKTFHTSSGEVGFENGRLHSFRHFFVSQAFQGGASEGDIRDWAGHTDSRLTERYRHQSTDEAQKKMRRLNFIDSH